MNLATKEDFVKFLQSIDSKYSYNAVSLVFAISETIVAEHGQTNLKVVIEELPKILLKVCGYLWEPTLKRYNIESWVDIKNIIIICDLVEILVLNDFDRLEDFDDEEKINPLHQRCLQLQNSGLIINSAKKLK